MRLLDVLPEEKFDRAIFAFTFLCVLFTPVSIAISQIFLTAAVMTWLFQAIRARRFAFSLPPIMLPILAFIMATTLSILLSSDFFVSVKAAKKFFLFLIILLVFNKFKTFDQVHRLYTGLFIVAGIASIYALAQYPSSDLLHRIKGFMGHWMTFSGLQMLLFTALLAFVLSYSNEALWAVPIFVIVAVAILFSLTRSVWLGVIFSSFVTMALKRSRLLLAIPFLVMLILVTSPRNVADRAKSIFTREDSAAKARISMLPIAANMVKAHPLIGVGPNLVPRLVHEYGADPTIPSASYIHLHNNFLQLAAERGLLGLMAWLWLLVKLSYDYYQMSKRTSFRDKRSYPLVAAISSLVALLIAGLFEYNFGDSEVIMLWFFILTAPYVVDQVKTRSGWRAERVRSHQIP